MASTTESGKIPIGSVGIALEEIQKDESGLAYFPGHGKVQIKALENLPKYGQIICVEEENKCREYRVIEAREKAWDVYREFSLAAGESLTPAVRVIGEGTLTSIGVYVDGNSADAKNLIIAVYHDREKYPSLYLKLSWLKTLGGDYVPTPNPHGGLTIENDTDYIYAGFINPEIEFKTRCDLFLANGDSANAATVKIFLFFKLKGTETEVFIKGGTGGGQGGIPEESATKDSTGTVGKGGSPWERIAPV